MQIRAGACPRAYNRSSTLAFGSPVVRVATVVQSCAMKRLLSLLLCTVLPMACAPRRTQREGRVEQVLKDARGHASTFARHFSTRVSPQVIAAWQESLAKEGPAKFEERDGPLCVRATWGDYVIDHSLYFFFEAPAADSPITSIVRDDRGFGAAMGELGRHNRPDGPTPTTELERCEAMNAAEKWIQETRPAN